MLLPGDEQSVGGELTPTVLRALLDGCRVDLDTVRRDARCSEAGDGHPAGQSDTAEERLCQAADRLERAADALDQALGSFGADGKGVAEVLAREADHRIKNGLQTVIVLLHDQATHAEQPAVRDALRLASGRITAIAQVHAKLHEVGQYGTVPTLELGGYLRDLCAALEQASGVDGDRRRLRVEVDALVVPPAIAQALGLIVTELVANALRHAFEPGERGVVRVSGGRRESGRYQLRVADDGRGLPACDGTRPGRAGLGLKLVDALVQQLSAELTVDDAEGASFIISLPLAADARLTG